MTTFLNIAIPTEFKESLGYVLISAASLNIGVNLALVIGASLMDTF